MPQLCSPRPCRPPADPLTTEIGALDAKVFGAYNRCDLPTFSGYFDPKVAFYHDTGGATFRVYPIKDYGAIEEGEHRFCELATGRCEGIAKFVIVWSKQDGAWRITSVLSYGHRAATSAEQRSATDR